jgi:hypothetical protein
MAPPTQTPHHNTNPRNIGRLDFSPEKIDPILAGEKTATIRYGLYSQAAFRIGSKFHLTTEDGDVFATATISDRTYTTAKSIVKNGIEGHHEYGSLDEFCSRLNRYYPDAEFKSDSCFEIIHWQHESLTEE